MPQTRLPSQPAATVPPSAAPRVGIDVRQPLLTFLWHELRIGVPLCTAVALFMTLAFGGGFLSMWVFSLCIGLLIQLLIEFGRLAISRWQQRGSAVAVAARSNWPGWGWMAPWVAFSTVVGYVLGSLAAGWLLGLTQVFATSSGHLRGLAVVMLISLGISIGVTYFFYSRGRLAASEAQAEVARRGAAENQLLLLQSQLEPHMLFNTLANLRVLIAVDPGAAQAMLDRLIGYLRATLGASRTAWHPLATEFDRLADYLALMSVRMGPRLQVAFELPAELRDTVVPALLLQPLVENSIKHGLEPKLEGGRIAISARRDANRLMLEVRDTGIGLRATANAPGDGRAPGTTGGGFGTAHVRERLQALYGDRASFQLDAAADAPGGAVARLTLPLPPSAGTP